MAVGHVMNVDGGFAGLVVSINGAAVSDRGFDSVVPRLGFEPYEGPDAPGYTVGTNRGPIF